MFGRCAFIGRIDVPVLQESSVNRLLQQTDSGQESHQLRVTGFQYGSVDEKVSVVKNLTITSLHSGLLDLHRP